MKNIVLTGIMGTGKTTVGRVLSKKLGLKFIDMDSEIEKQEGLKIKEIFEEYGEERFRDIESEMAIKAAKNKKVVISTGGGIVLRDENIDTLSENGIIVNLTAIPETIIERTIANDDRPLLNVENPLDKLNTLLEQREPLYKKADIIVDTNNRSPIMIAEEIIENIGRIGSQ